MTLVSGVKYLLEGRKTDLGVGPKGVLDRRQGSYLICMLFRKPCSPSPFV